MTSLTINAYLFFNGNCAEAMRTYARILGGEVRMLTYGEAPDGQFPPGTPKEMIMHARVDAGGATIMAADDCSGRPYRGMSGSGVALSCPNEAETNRVFDALAEGGDIVVPVAKTFWSPAFGMVNDRFGVLWLVATESPESA